MAVLGFLLKLKRGLRLPFAAHFLHDFSIKIFSFKAMADREKNNGRRKFKYVGKEKSFLDEMKIIFHSFWRAIIWL